MKTKLVLIANREINEVAEKVILAYELNAETNKVLSWTFEGEHVTEEFTKALMEQWRKGEAVAFPEGVNPKEIVLSASAQLLPEGVKTDREELLSRTQTEWMFIVLSTKLYKNYQVELEELQQKVDGLKSYSKDMWESMKGFWSKVQTQVSEQNLFREHTNTLRNRTNEIFAQLKQMRSEEDAQFESEALVNYEKIDALLKPIEAKIEEAKVDFQKVFEELKGVQNKFKGAQLTRNLRSKLWERIDNSFKVVKSKRSPDSSPENRLVRRIDGLKGAIQKMERSIERDERDLSSQMSKINSGNARQLETQLREVRAKLIRERIESKSKKLADMHKTLAELDTRHKRNMARIEKEKIEAEKILAEKAKKEAEAAEKAKEAAAEKEKEAAPEVVVEAAKEEEASTEVVEKEAEPVAETTEAPKETAPETPEVKEEPTPTASEDTNEEETPTDASDENKE